MLKELRSEGVVDPSSPIVLVSQGMGSFVGAVFSRVFPADVHGMVYLDPTPPHIFATWREASPLLGTGLDKQFLNARDTLRFHFLGFTSLLSGIASSAMLRSQYPDDAITTALREGQVLYER